MKAAGSLFGHFVSSQSVISSMQSLAGKIHERKLKILSFFLFMGMFIVTDFLRFSLGFLDLSSRLSPQPSSSAVYLIYFCFVERSFWKLHSYLSN